MSFVVLRPGSKHGTVETPSLVLASPDVQAKHFLATKFDRHACL
jgi:hypothetical protein